MKLKYTIITLMGLLPILGLAQVQSVQQKLEQTAVDFLKIYNTGDSALYRSFLQKNTGSDKLVDKLRRFENTWKSIGTVKIGEIRIKGNTRVDVAVQEQKYGGWWRFSVETDSNQHFLNRTVVPIQMPEVGIKDGALNHQEISKAIDDFLDRKLKGDFSGNVFVSENRKVFYSRSVGKSADGVQNTPTTQFGLASSGKLFTAISIFQLKEKGLLTLEDKVSRFFPNLKNPIFERISVGQLLNHSSGLGDFFEDPSYKEGLTDMDDPHTVELYLEKSNTAFQPGTDFRYSNTGFLLLGLIIEKCVGSTFREYIVANVFDKAGMKSSLAGNGAGGGKSNVADLVLFFAALQDGVLLGRAATERLLQYKFAENYGYGSEHHLLGKEHIFGHSGGFINECVELNLYQNTGRLVIILSNSNPPFGHFLANKIKELLIRKE
ncbi:MAG: serine hydrolase domain-containing protein [Bacteroidia bacterium]